MSQRAPMLTRKRTKKKVPIFTQGVASFEAVWEPEKT